MRYTNLRFTYLLIYLPTCTLFNPGNMNIYMVTVHLAVSHLVVSHYLTLILTLTLPLESGKRR